MIADWFNRLTSLPAFDDEEQMRKARMLNTILWASCLCTFFLGLAAPYAYQNSPPILATATVAFLLIIGNLFLLKKGKVYLAGLLFSFSIWLLIAVLTVLSGGVNTDAYKAQFIIILFAGILLGWRMGFSFVFLSMLWGLLLIVAEQQKVLPPAVLASSDPISAWVSATITFVMTAVWMHIATENTRRALNQLKDSNEQLQARSRELEAIRQISLQLAATLDLESLLSSTINTAATLLRASRGELFLYREDEQVLELVAHYHFDDTPLDTKLQIGQGLAGTVWQLGNSLIVDNYREWSGNLPNLAPVIGDGAVAGIVLQRSHEKLGVLTLAAEDDRTFTQHDIELLNLLMAGAAIAIQNARLHKQQQQTEIALRDSEEAARVLLNAPPDDFYLLNKTGLILDLNETAAKKLNQPVSALANQAIVYDLFPEVATKERRKTIQEVFSTGLEADFEDQRNGRWFANGIYPIFDLHGQVTRVAIYTHDITEEKSAATEREILIANLENKNKELERFTYTVSHDLKSPLVTIMGFLGFIEKDVAVGNLERLPNDLKKIRNAAENMQELLNNLLELSRIGRLINPPTQVPFAQIVEEALTIVDGAITARLIQVEVADDMPVITVDRVRLVEVVQNLLENAIRFMGEQPSPQIRIGVRYDEHTDQPIYFVQDNGIGIAPQYHENIFGLFNRLNSQLEGTGIGLALVKRIIEVHGGQVWVESAVGEGATFFFTLGSASH